MNKLKLTISALLIASFGITAMNAQDKPAAAPAKQTPAKESPKPAKTSKKVQGSEQKPQTKPAASGQHLKKDGTPDMRYKENKGTAAPAKKADGKGEKKAAPKKATTGDNKTM